MKVGIVSCYFHYNYGSMLQAYATQWAVDSLGGDAITIACNSPITYMTQPKINYYIHKVTNGDIVRTKIRQYRSKKNMKNYPNIKKCISERNKKFYDFSLSNFNLSELNVNRKSLSEFTSTCDAVVVGSDMLWHPVNVEHDYFTLTFVPDGVKKISYATSIGTAKIPMYQIETYKRFLSRFKYISVREQSGVEVISNLNIGKQASLVLDPTLLFTGEEWMRIQEKEPIIEGKYILCYFLGVNQEHRKFAQELKKVTGCKIVALQHLDEFVKNDIGFGDIISYDIGPAELVNLIRNAEFVCTDSFHGTCFSILNHKKFFIMNRFSNSNTQSTNTRIDSLLSLTGLEKQKIGDNWKEHDLFELLNNEIQYKLVDKKIEEERQKSLAYLKNALYG